MSYIGRTPTYGVLEKQVLTPDSVEDTFLLTYEASATSLLVVYEGAVQEPDVDYSIVSGNTEIQFSFVPTTGNRLYIIYLGRELTT